MKSMFLKELVKLRKKQKRMINNFLKQTKKIHKVDFKARKDKEIKYVVETTHYVVKGEEPLKQHAETTYL